MAGQVVTGARQGRGTAQHAAGRRECSSVLDESATSAWRESIDCVCALAAGLLAYQARFFDERGHAAAEYLAISLILPLLWLLSVALAGGYDPRFIGVGSDEFRKVVNAGVCLTAAVAVLAYATKADIARGYVVIALPWATLFDLLARYALRKRLHRQRSRGPLPAEGGGGRARATWSPALRSSWAGTPITGSRSWRRAWLGPARSRPC